MVQLISFLAIVAKEQTFFLFCILKKPKPNQIKQTKKSKTNQSNKQAKKNKTKQNKPKQIQAARLREYEINRTNNSKLKTLDWSSRKSSTQKKDSDGFTENICYPVEGAILTYGDYFYYVYRKSINKVLHTIINFRKRQMHLTCQVVKKTPIKLEETFWKKIFAS